MFRSAIPPKKYQRALKKASTESGTAAYRLAGGFSMDKKEEKEEVKRIFTGYKRMTPKITRELRRLGIFVVRQRNHVVLSVSDGETRHLVPISSTGGDKRGGLNMARKIISCL